MARPSKTRVRPITVALVYVPVPAGELSSAERRFSVAFFQFLAQTHFSDLTSGQLVHLWEVEKVHQGLLYVASILRENDFGVKYYASANDPAGPRRDPLARLREQLRSDVNSIDLVCFYSITCNYHIAEQLALELKDAKRDVVVGIGGPHATATAEEILSGPVFSPAGQSDGLPCPFDFVGIGEGERTVLDVAMCLAEGRGIGQVPGIYWRANGRPHETPKRPRMDPVVLSPPAYDLAGIEILPAARIFPNRGCPNRCAFCADPWRRSNGKAKPVTFMPLESVKAELRLLHRKYKTKYLYLGCEDFLWDENRAVALARLIDQTCPDISWVGQCRAKGRISPDTLKALRECGCIGLEFGVESASDAILGRVNKNITLEMAENSLRQAKEYGFLTHAYWMLGLPMETRITAEATQELMLNWASQGLVDTWEYKIYIPYPGTPAFDSPERYGVDILTRDYRKYHYCMPPVISVNGISSTELKQVHDRGLNAGAKIFESRLNGQRRQLGIDLSTIENMF